MGKRNLRPSINSVFAVISLCLLARCSFAVGYVEPLWLAYLWPVPKFFREKDCAIPFKFFACLISFLLIIAISGFDVKRDFTNTSALLPFQVFFNAGVCLAALLASVAPLLGVTGKRFLNAFSRLPLKLVINTLIGLCSASFMLFPDFRTQGVLLQASWLLFNCIFLDNDNRAGVEKALTGLVVSAISIAIFLLVYLVLFALLHVKIDLTWLPLISILSCTDFVGCLYLAYFSFRRAHV